MDNYRQIIRVPDKVTTDFFNLPCVLGASKNKYLEHGIFFTVDAKDTYGKEAILVYPGDYICENYEGKWTAYSAKSKETEELRTLAKCTLV